MKALMMVAVFLLMAQVAAGDPLSELAAEYKKAGEPVYPADFEVKDLAEADNAAIELRKAATAFSDESDAWKAYDALREITPPLNDEQALVLQKVVLENLKTIEHIDAAMKRKGFDWQIRMTTPTPAILLPHLNKQRGLARMLAADALLMHQQGSHGQALRDVQRMMFISRAVDRQGFLIGHLVSLAVMAQATHVLEQITPTLKIGDGGAASAEQVKALIGELLDESSSRQGMRMGLFAERMSQLDIASSIANGTLTPAKLGQLMSGDLQTALPVRISMEDAQADGVMLMRHTSEVVNAAEASADWPTFQSKYPKRPKELESQQNNHVLARMMLPALERALLSDYRASADRRLAAVALAVRLYAAQNDGKLPATLDELVPKFLPAVPLDPMTRGERLRYDAARGIAYSVGEDGKDDGGSDAKLAKPSGPPRWQRKDVIFRLTAAANPQS